MAKGPDERQATTHLTAHRRGHLAAHLFGAAGDALRLMGRARQDLTATGAISVALVPAWRALAPTGHPGAGMDAIDADTIGRLARFAAPLLSARSVLIRQGGFRAAPQVSASDGRGDHGADVVVDGVGAADGIALVLTVALEGMKRAHGMQAGSAALQRAFASPADARAALDALQAAGGARSVAVEPGPAEAATTAALIETVGVAAEGTDGLVICGAALCVQTERLRDAGLDRRAREALGPLKKSRAAIVLIDDADTLSVALAAVGARARRVALVGAGTATGRPRWLRDVTTDLLVASPDPSATGPLCHSHPTLQMVPAALWGAAAESPADAHAFDLVQAALAAQAAGQLGADAELTVEIAATEDPAALPRAALRALPAPRAEKRPVPRRR
jgi:hypothetical protein